MKRSIRNANYIPAFRLGQRDVFETFNVMKSFARVLPELSWSLSSLTGLISL